jgi:hypothetical protein
LDLGVVVDDRVADATGERRLVAEVLENLVRFGTQKLDDRVVVIHLLSL